MTGHQAALGAEGPIIVELLATVMFPEWGDNVTRRSGWRIDRRGTTNLPEIS
jgi:hypothetical protein